MYLTNKEQNILYNFKKTTVIKGPEEGSAMLCETRLRNETENLFRDINIYKEVLNDA